LALFWSDSAFRGLGCIHPVNLLYGSLVPTNTGARDAAALDVATARFFRVLGHPTRLAILELLLERPRTVSELVNALALSQSRISNHLACLRWCRFAASERQGREVMYRISDPSVRDVVAVARTLAERHCDHLTSCTRIGPDWI
jgi:ArsR family transcriptional regulator, cadmium/lead-responsive transcriptional repressor